MEEKKAMETKQQYKQGNNSRKQIRIVLEFCKRKIAEGVSDLIRVFVHIYTATS